MDTNTITQTLPTSPENSHPLASYRVIAIFNIFFGLAQFALSGIFMQDIARDWKYL